VRGEEAEYELSYRVRVAWRTPGEDAAPAPQPLEFRLDYGYRLEALLGQMQEIKQLERELLRRAGNALLQRLARCGATTPPPAA